MLITAITRSALNKTFPSVYAIALLLMSASAGGQEHPGAQVFADNCSGCHVSAENIGDTEIAPSLESLQTLTAASLEFAINEGVMYGQASVLSNEQKAQIVDYLAVAEDDSWLQDTMCSESARTVDLKPAATLARVGVDYFSTRDMSAEQAGLSKSDFENLELAWTVAFPDVSALRASPVIVGDTVFYSATGSRKVLALDANSGCAKWVFDSPTRLRSS